MNKQLRQTLTDALLACNADEAHAAQDGTYGFVLEALKRVVSAEDLEAAHSNGYDWEAIDEYNAEQAERAQRVADVKRVVPASHLRTILRAGADDYADGTLAHAYSRAVKAIDEGTDWADGLETFDIEVLIEAAAFDLHE